MTSTAAYGAALRTDIKQEKGGAAATDRRGKNSILFHDFSSAEPGTTPSGIGIGGTSGGCYVTTEIYEVAPGVRKNCLVMYDATFDSSYSGPSVSIPVGGADSGLVSVEVRYMFDKKEGTSSNYTALPIMLKSSSDSMMSRHLVASANGFQHINGGGVDQTVMENECISANTWYTATWIIDFDKQRLDFTLLNEGKNSRNYAMDLGFYDGNESKNLSQILIQSQCYGGTWVFDYVKLNKESARMVQGESDNSIKKGVEAEIIAAPATRPLDGRINICVDGKYKYTTEAPYTADNGAVMATAKNLASFFGARYLRLGDSYTISSGDKTLTINANSGGGGITQAQQKDNQLFISVEELCKAFGYEYGYDGEASTAFVKTKAETGEAGEEEGGNTDEE